MPWEWNNSGIQVSRSYVCGHCGNHLASNVGYWAQNTSSGNRANIYICHFCSAPTFFDKNGKQHPGAAFGETVEHISSKDIVDLYKEARDCMKVSAFTPAVLACRKLLM